ncbi:MAG: hypothetical protein H0X65_11440 [Gemmatimonadetes bacterium]|nr:hypothetical protein [Gemmatimonadota bacterium]
MATITIPQSVMLWTLGGKQGNVRAQNAYTSNSGYSLLCSANKQHLTWVKQRVGVNLGYTSNAQERKVHFLLPDGKQRDILTGEPVAFGIGGGEAYLKYAERTIGINLAWTKSPVFEWRLYDDTGRKGAPIPTGARIAIVNEKVEPSADFLVYLDRPTGGDVGWTTSPDFWKRVQDIAEKTAVEAFKKLIL